MDRTTQTIEMAEKQAYENRTRFLAECALGAYATDRSRIAELEASAAGDERNREILATQLEQAGRREMILWTALIASVVFNIALYVLRSYQVIGHLSQQGGMR